MDITISPSHLSGALKAIPSKSQAHRLLICAAFADKSTHLYCPESNQDIAATVNCLEALGAVITRTADGYIVDPIDHVPNTAVLNCYESGSTLRFMLPIIGALGVDGTFHLAGRLPQRPLSPLWEEMVRMGCALSRPTATAIRCTGKLHSGNYSIAGNVSSQFITGLLFAMALMDGRSTLTITNDLESQHYIQMTQSALAMFQVDIQAFSVACSFPFHSPGNITVEGDWSNAAFFLVANALGSCVTVSNLNMDSDQGDRAILKHIGCLEQYCLISAADIPDLIPILCVLAAAKNGATFTHIQRLRLKESDRVASVVAMLAALDIRAEASENTLTVYPGRFKGGIVDSEGDHRIAMAAAIAATIADSPVTILNAQCVSKSYPSFWDEYRRLGGQYEQYIR